jgi:hypothetical protein
VNGSEISSIGNVMYASHGIWLVVTGFILLLAMVGAIAISLKPKSNEGIVLNDKNLYKSSSSGKNTSFPSKPYREVGCGLAKGKNRKAGGQRRDYSVKVGASPTRLAAQKTALSPQYITGFTDAEGCFIISLITKGSKKNIRNEGHSLVRHKPRPEGDSFSVPH